VDFGATRYSGVEDAKAGTEVPVLASELIECSEKGRYKRTGFFHLGDIYMEAITTVDDAFEVGAWTGRRQAFALVAGRCSAADADILAKIREEKLFRSMEPSWDAFCSKRLGLTRSYVDRIIRQYKELGPAFAKLNSFTQIKPSEYRRIAGAITEDGLAFGGEVIALEPENAPQLAEAVQALRTDATAEADSPDSAEQAFAKAEKSVKVAIAEFQRLHAMPLDENARNKLIVLVDNCRRQFSLLRSVK
jgi:hypothetical protein